MHILKGGQIVVVDDNYAEAAPLLQALGKNGAPHIYYTGAMEFLPETSLTGVRYIFLDIELAGMQGQSPKNKASALTAVLQKIISPNNGPCIVVFWTKHDEVIEQVKTNLSATTIQPVAYITADKRLCLAGDIEGISVHIEEKISTLGAFKLYVEWENVLALASKEFVRDFASLAAIGPQWSKETEKLFFRLYKAFVDQNDLTDENEKFKCACYLMNRSFVDALHAETNKSLRVPSGFSLNGGGEALSDEIKAKLNTSLFLSYHHMSRPSTGYVFIARNDCLREMLAKKLFKRGAPPNSSQLFQVLITPECDLAQKKTLMVSDDIKMQQVVYGIFYKLEELSLADELDRINKSQSIYRIAPVWHEGAIHVFALHFSTLSFIRENKLSAPVFSLNRDLVFDLQSKAANHLNRLGNYLL